MPKGYWITCYREIKNPDKVAGYRGGLVDKAIMAVNDAFVVLPVLPILLLLQFLLRERMSWFHMALMMALLGWAYDARLIRAQVMSLKERVFSETAVFCGMPTRRIILREQPSTGVRRLNHARETFPTRSAIETSPMENKR